MLAVGFSSETSRHLLPPWLWAWVVDELCVFSPELMGISLGHFVINGTAAMA
jgi:hypothetical protein